MKNIKYIQLFIVLSCIAWLSACSNNIESTTVSTELLASISTAQKLGVTAGNDSVSTQGLGVQSKSATTDFRLVQVESVATTTGASTTKKVFNIDVEAYFVAKINNTVIVTGSFPNIQWSDGVYTCYMVSFSTLADNEKAKCLSKLPIGSFSPSMGKSNAHYSKIGIKQRGNSLYFVTNDMTSSYVSKWTDGDSLPTVILTKPLQGLGFEDIFLDNSGSNICVLAPAVSSIVLYPGQIFCGTDNSTSWADISASLVTTSSTIIAETFQVDNMVVSNDKKFDMATLTVSTRTTNGSNGGLPSGYANRVSVPDGGMIVRAYAGSISYVDASGNTTIVGDYNSTFTFWFKVLGSGNYAWVYGGNDYNDESNGTSLKRVNLTTHLLEPTNYYSQTGLVSISDMAYDADGTTIVVKGKNGAGITAYAKIDSSGTISILSSISSDLFSSLLSL